MHSQDRVEKDVRKAQVAIENQLGRHWGLFRPVVGYTNPKIARTLKKEGLRCIGWRLRSYDSVYKETSKLLKRLTSKVKPGDIVLFHDNLEVTMNTLETFIQSAQQNGINFVSAKEIENILDA